MGSNQGGIRPELFGGVLGSHCAGEECNGFGMWEGFESTGGDSGGLVVYCAKSTHLLADWVKTTKPLVLESLGSGA